MPDGIDFIASTTASSNIANITFDTSGLSGYTKFIIKISGRTNSQSITQPFFIELNNTDLSGVHIYAGSNIQINTIGDEYFWMPALDGGTQAFGGGEIEILDPFSTTTAKIVIARGYGGTTNNGRGYIWWAGSNTSGNSRVDSIKFTASGDIATNSKISLYGIISTTGSATVTTA